MKIISVIICTYNRAKLLDKCLHSLRQQTLDQKYFEIIIIDNNSEDNTQAIIKKYQNVLPITCFLEKNQGLSYARNRGIKEANTEYLAFLDDDAKPDPSWLQQAIKIIRDKGPQIFGGPIYPFYLHNKPRWFLDKYETRKVTEQSRYVNELTNFFSGSNFFITKLLCQKVKGFDEKLGMKGKKISVGEDTNFQIKTSRLKIPRYYELGLIVYHYVPTSKMKLSYIFKRKFWSGYYSNLIFGKQKNIILILLSLFYNLISFLLKGLLFFLRQRKKFKYWQNYLIHILSPLLHDLGRLSYLIEK